MAAVSLGLEEIAGYFDDLEDPRSTINQKHPLVSVVVIALMAVLAGARGPTSIAKWATIKESFLRGVLDLPNGVPRKDVFRRVLALLNPAAVQACFATWLTALRASAKTTKTTQSASWPWGCRRRRHCERLWTNSLTPPACWQRPRT